MGKVSESMPIDLLFKNRVIGQMPSSWAKVKIDQNLVDILGGFSCPKSRAIASGLPHFRPFNITTEGEVVYTPDTVHIPNDYQTGVDRYFLLEGDVLFNNTNSVELVGKTGIVRQPMQVAFSNHINRLRVRNREQIDPKWLALFLRDLQSRGFFAANCNKWIGQAGFSVDSLSEVDIPLPDIGIQRQIVARIAALLSEVREMREINQRIIEDTNSLLLSTLGQLFPNPDRLLPEGWRLKTIEEISKNPQYGFTTSAKSEPIGPKFLRITDIQNGMVDWNTVPFCECNQRELDRYRLIHGDIVFARTGATTGKTFIISAPPEAVFASYLIRLQIERDASPDFVYWFFQSPYYWRQIIPRGGAQPNMNAQLLKKVKIPVPENPKIQEKIIAQVYSIQNEILQMQKDQNATGKMILDLEQAILAQAFRGEL
ncbi:MAG: hypothetical protein CVU42_00170 [Chloroflexi bacterium HGW-Chloroflexi-4]|jgi:type I restriction enzyme S subunit|nr:MAG: hypothetical protein CVU42_00170 [Chloroflexi bacterium HGW-Chloroflexi-4]